MALISNHIKNAITTVMNEAKQKLQLCLGKPTEQISSCFEEGKKEMVADTIRLVC